ncbi:MAG: hypothetical protein SCM11_08180 [Bacillota bacterium]|nr:hypothetical protein [Bacillota bacterium]
MIRKILTCVVIGIFVCSVVFTIFLKYSYKDQYAALEKNEVDNLLISYYSLYTNEDEDEITFETISQNTELIIQAICEERTTQYRCTLLRLSVVQILKGVYEENEIFVYEPSYIFARSMPLTYKKGIMRFCIVDGYIPMSMNNQYILFLNKAENAPSDSYVLAHNQYSKFPVIAGDIGIYDSSHLNTYKYMNIMGYDFWPDSEELRTNYIIIRNEVFQKYSVLK